MIYMSLFFVFFRIGLFSFGGGLAMLPLLEKELISRTWINSSEFYNLVAVSQATPGAVSISLATYVGEKLGGITGSLFAIVGICLPSFILAFLLFNFLLRFQEHPMKSAIFRGISAGSISLLFFAAYSIGANIVMVNNKFNIKIILLILLSFYLIRKTKMHPLIVLFGSGILSAIIK